MELNQRDLSIVHHVDRFKQLSSSHIRDLLFAAQLSRTSCHRRLQRLTELGFLHRVERRVVGGMRGGSGQFVYSLGRKGFYIGNSGRYNPARSVNYHALAIADVYLVLLKCEREGGLRIVGCSTEPDCHVTVGGCELKPDLYVELEREGKRLKAFLEIDLATEGQKQIKEKLSRYWQAYNQANTEAWPVFPMVLWIAVDVYRAKELQWLIEQGPTGAAAIFKVTTLADFSTVL
jgi:DNA-binding Lrp family transcriptional regulator